jgi:hypothetical protein
MSAPLQRAAVVNLPRAVAAEDSLPTVRQATLLARLLAETMLANVQRTAALNLAAADSLLVHARIPKPPVFDERSDEWRMAWRSFEICATTADRLLDLTRGHIERSSTNLWRITERLFGELGQLPSSQLDILRSTFATLREAQDAYLRASQAAHQNVISLAQNTGAHDGH